MFVRWSNLETEVEQRARLPGYREEALVRHFDAPEAVETRFYEVRAKSILNRVPEASQVPFRWTINVYRGCTHSCVYCLAGDTPILLADGRHKPISELEVGDAIYGTRVAASGYRHYVRTTVLDKWITVKPAYRLTLEGGTELILSADHRLLSNRGWRHLLGSPRGQPDRPSLTTRDRLAGTGPSARQPSHDAEYRRGYLCGIIRADGFLRSDGDRWVARWDCAEDGLGLSLAEPQVLRRVEDFVASLHVPTGRRVRQLAAVGDREPTARYAPTPCSFDRVRTVAEWPARRSPQWCRGFLAGVYDAGGSRSDFALRIATGDPEILGSTEACARRLGFDVALDRAPGTNGLRCIRIRGGLSEHLRFFHLTDPAIERKRSFDGQTVKTLASLRVAAIEPLGRALPLYDIKTGTGDFIANGVVSHNCFARPTHKYLDFNAGRDFEREIVVKVNAPELLRAELARPKWTHEHVALGTNTDPYQWVEGRYKLMPGIWEAMRDAGNPCSVLTKSPLLLRDLPLMQQIAQRTEFSAALSVPTLDERAWRATEPHSPNPRARLEAVAELTRAGIRTGVLVAPLMPGINDAPDQVAKILELASEAGAAYVTGIALHLRGDVRGLFFEWLESHRPDLVDRYKRLYQRGAYAHPDERRRLSELVKGPDRPPRERMRWRTQPAASDREDANTGRNEPVWLPEQGRLF
ncbi:MAG TPA: hypothetical protein VMJ65_11680 [Solirubrobacteraceae bacterium]|nr:hypothetical protein [Solirubrobacteraceae bacterium]